MKTVAASPALYFIMLRHRTLSPTIYLTEVTRKPFALSQTFFLSSGGKSAVLAKKNAPPRSGILLSMHVVLKTRHANPNILVPQTYLPLVRNFYPYVEQQPTMGLHRIPLLVCTPSIEIPLRSGTSIAHTLIAKRDTPSYTAYPIKDESQAPALLRELALGGIWMERSYSSLPVEVVDADLTARTYAVGRTRRADT